MWWLYVPLAFGNAVVLIIQEEPDGSARSTTAPGSGVTATSEQLGWPRVRIITRHRIPDRGDDRGKHPRRRAGALRRGVKLAVPTM